jgi:hypothetical protein
VPEVPPPHPKGMEPSLERPGRERDGADPHHTRALTPGAGTEGSSRGKTLSPPGTGPLGDDLCNESPTGQGREVRGLP